MYPSRPKPAQNFASPRNLEKVFEKIFEGNILSSHHYRSLYFHCGRMIHMCYQFKYMASLMNRWLV